MKVQLDSFPFPVSMRVSARAKRMAIHVEENGEVELVLPRRASRLAGVAFLRERTAWIVDVIKKQQINKKILQGIKLEDGVMLNCFGDQLQLRIYVEPNRARSFVEEEKGMIIARIGDVDKLQTAISKFYITQAKQYFIGQVHEYTQIIKKSVKRVRVIDMKTQWGSCNHRTHALTFNWRLALAPEHVARYVVAHEVAHIIHPNHSQVFWKLVGKLNPSYATSRAWLRQYGGQLRLEK
ncbi:MAG: SprT family zinc-dependent metalloprotease [Candidatus Andersenbacteria bacterium]